VIVGWFLTVAVVTKHPSITEHVNSQLRERKVLAGPQPPDPEPEIHSDGLVLDRDYYGGPYYFKGTKVRASFIDIGYKILIATSEQRISYDYDPYKRTWTPTPRTYINTP
jgi:hypothetical protein